MSWDLALRHCAATRATLEQTRVSLELISAQLAGLEAYAKAQHEREAVPTATLELPERCAAIDDSNCALQCQDARRDFASLSHPHRWVCDGCDVVSQDGVTTT